MNQHDYSYDYLRAFSAVMIVLCHICFGFGLSAELGRYLGGVYVSVFLLLSAYLLGIGHNKTISGAPVKFLKSRLLKLLPTYYLFLLITFFIISFAIGYWYLSPKQILGHILFTNYFIPSTRISQPPLPQLGHLWFMSCIVASYVFVAFLSGLSLFRNRKLLFWVYYMATMAALGFVLCRISRYCIYPSVVLTLFPVFFLKEQDIVIEIRKIPSIFLIMALVVLNVGTIVAYQMGLRESPPLSFLMISINAFLWIVCAPLIFKSSKIPSWVGFLSGISFEIYLIHHPFCLGKYSLTQYMPEWAAIISVFVISISLGYLLNRLVRCLRQLPILNGKCSGGGGGK